MPKAGWRGIDESIISSRVGRRIARDTGVRCGRSSRRTGQHECLERHRNHDDCERVAIERHCDGGDDDGGQRVDGFCFRRPQRKRRRRDHVSDDGNGDNDHDDNDDKQRNDDGYRDGNAVHDRNADANRNDESVHDGGIDDDRTTVADDNSTLDGNHNSHDRSVGERW